MSKEESNCAMCDRPDWVDKMVECGSCMQWIHFRCAGVTDSIEFKDWTCRSCLPISVSSKSRSKSASSSVQKSIEQMRLEEEQKIRKKRFLREKALEKKRIEQEQAAEQRQIVEEEALERTFLEERIVLLEKQQSEASDGKSSLSRTSCQNSNEKVSQWISSQGQMERINKIAPNPHDSITNMPLPSKSASNNDLLNISRGKFVSNPPSLPLQDFLTKPSSSTMRFYNNQNTAMSNGSTVSMPPETFSYSASIASQTNAIIPAAKSTPIDVNLLHSSATAPVHSHTQLQDIPAKQSAHIRKTNVRIASPPNTAALLEDPNTNLSTRPLVPAFPSSCSESMPVDETIHSLSSMQIAARRVMTRDLPEFSGRPEDWPIFISQYNITTASCGYSHAENLVRLQRCLKGHARESVRSRLLLPASVPQVINTLHMLYGRPEILINSLLNKIRAAPNPKIERLETLIEFGTELQGLCDHILAAKEESHLNNPSLIGELETKLPAQLKLQWAMHKLSEPQVNLQTFADYMAKLVTAATQVTTLNLASNEQRGGERTKKEKSFLHTHHSTSIEPISAQAQTNGIERKCPNCEKQNHRVKDCGEFRELSVDERWKRLQALKLCRICLNQHGRSRCRLANKCGVDGCLFRHHPLLHAKRENKPVLNLSVENHTHCDQKSNILFRILPITLHGKNGPINTYAFLDDGSSVTLIERSVAQQLGENGPSGTLCLKWTNDVSRCENDSQKISLYISSATGGKVYQIQTARTVSELKLPKQSIDSDYLVQSYPYLNGLPIPNYRNAVPQVLIGLDQLKLSLPLKYREGKEGEPVATKTRLGWCVHGGASNDISARICCHVMGGSETDLCELIKTYFGQEDCGTLQGIIIDSKENLRAKEILKNTTVRKGERFETGLLWRYDKFELPESYHMALRRLECLERKMALLPGLKNNICRQIQEYQCKQYAHRASEQELNSADTRRIWYLPIGTVINPKKPEKVRLIWDAAAKVDGISLNSVLLKGPDMLSSLPGVLFYFREKSVAICGDIREMFHQIRIRPEDRHSQRFLWRDHPSMDPEIFLMDVATFGSTCSPSSAQFIKNTNADEYADKYPRAVEAIKCRHYVDDYFDSFDTSAEAIKVASEVKTIHEKGGFEIRNWLCNKPIVLDALDNAAMSTIKELTSDKINESQRVLGMLWLPVTDTLGFSTKMSDDLTVVIKEGTRPTKRQVLRSVMSLFDPLGLLALYLVHGKILIQTIWRSGIGWDDAITNEVYERWIQWLEVLQKVDQIQIPRCYVGTWPSDILHSVQLHTFVDASEEAYCCTSYFRCELRNGSVVCNIVSAKTKVAPLKPLSIPRLELQAAVLGVRLAKFIKDNHSIAIEKKVFWSDSTTVLAWIQSDSRRYRQYVSCRIGEILTLSECSEWRWVPSKLNVADEGTKWGKGPCLLSEGKWFRGPDFLYLSEQNWPQQKDIVKRQTTEELRVCAIHELQPAKAIVCFDRFSSWNRLIRTVAYVRRFVHNITVKGDMRKSGPLTSEELAQSENTIWSACQQEAYPDEYTLLNSKKGMVKLAKGSKIYKLSPFTDENGVLRQDGRIGAARNIENDVKFPIILPKAHKVTELILKYYHEKYHHANVETVINEIRQKYYIPQLRTTARKISRICQWCKVYKSEPSIPKMAPLPAARLSAFERPFSYIGIDFFGPILVKFGRGQTKRWVALFTCMTVRAVHLEVVHTLNTESCIMCFRRFVGRRGAPLEVFSDNGTNFHGAERVLRNEINRGLSETFTNADTKWFFNPPAAPHMGGAWERLVRSVKTAMGSISTETK